MPKKVKALWKKYSDAGAVDDMPPTKADAKLRDKHVADSVPYNVGHATDHMDEIVNQLKKLQPVNPRLTRQLGQQAVRKLHGVEQKVNRMGGRRG